MPLQAVNMLNELSSSVVDLARARLSNHPSARGLLFAIHSILTAISF